MTSADLGTGEPELVIPISYGASIPTSLGEFRAAAYAVPRRGTVHIAFFMGTVKGESDVLTRLHSACMTGDVMDSLRCDCGVQLEEAMKRISEEGLGVVVYNPSHEGRGIGLFEKLRAYRLQDEGLDTVEANLALGHPPDSRDYSTEAAILLDLGVKNVKLMTNNPHKVQQLQDLGVPVSLRIPLAGTKNRTQPGLPRGKVGETGALAGRNELKSTEVGRAELPAARNSIKSRAWNLLRA